MNNTFLGATIKPIKEVQTNTNNTNNSDYIIVTTCYFHNMFYYFDEKSFEYLDGLIQNIETFNMKVKQFTTNPDKWIYRIYIDEFVLNIKSVMDTIMNGNLKKKYKIIKTDDDYINELDKNIKQITNNINSNYNIFVFIQNLLTKYFKLITESRDEKYKNIEIFTYNNDNAKYKLYSNPDINISGEIATYGTLFRFHSILDTKASVVIMRNCSHNMTPLDIIIQNYWIEKSDKEFMEYVATDYGFVHRWQNIEYWYKTLYNKKTNDKKTRSKKIKHFNYDRVMAGLFGCKIGRTNSSSNRNNYNTHKYYQNIFNELNHKLVESKIFINNKNSKTSNHKYNNTKNSIIKYDYGVDEAIIQFIFPNLRKVSYRNNFKKNNPDNTVQHTFAIKMENKINVHNCNKCDKATKKQLNIIKKKKTKKNKKNKNNKIILDNETKDSKDGKDDKAIKNDKEKSNCNMKTLTNCRLYDIYKDDKNKYNMPNYVIDNFKDNYTSYDIKYLRALPFVILNENTWEIQNLPMSLLISSIMFKNIYNFALKTYISKYDKYLPYFIKDSLTKKKDDKKDEKEKNEKKDEKDDKKKDDDDDDDNDKNKLDDPYLVLCSLKKKNLDIDKFLEHLPIAYNENNFYPVIFYPKKLTLLNYTKLNNTILFKKMLEPINNKHKLKLQ